MSDCLDRYLAWLDPCNHERAPGFYGLLKLPLYEMDSDRIQQALFHESWNVSSFLRGPQRELAEAVLEEINRAESCLTEPDVKAAYDALLKQSTAAQDAAMTPTPTAEGIEPLLDEEEDMPLPAIGVHEAALALATSSPSATTVGSLANEHLAPAPLHEAETSRQSQARRVSQDRPASRNDAAARANQSILEAVQNTRRRSTDSPKKSAAMPQPVAAHSAERPQETNSPSTQPVDQRLAMSTAIAQALRRRVPAPLIKHRRGILAGVVALAGVTLALQATISSFDKPRTARPRIKLDSQEELLVTQQIAVLYDTQQETATRAAAAEKLQGISAAAVQKFSYRLQDVAGRQPEESIQQSLQGILQNAGNAH